MRRLAFLWMCFQVSCFSANAQTVSYFPRVVSAADTSTGIAISNPTADTATVTLTLYNSDGNTVGSPAVVTIVSAGQYAKLSSEIFPASQNQKGWVRMSSTVAGIAAFFLNGDFVRTTDGGELVTPSAAFTFPWIVETPATSTEITLTNPNDTTASVQLTLVDALGNIVENRPVLIPRNAQLIGTIATLLGINTTTLGYLRASSSASTPIFGVEAVRDGTRDFAILNGRVDAPVNTLVFPHVASGGGYTTGIFVQNTGAAPQSVTYQLFADDGSAAASKILTIAPGQLLRQTVAELFSLTGTDLQTGWVRAFTNSAVLEGFQSFQAIDTGALTALPARKTPSIYSLQSQVAEETASVFQEANLYTGLAVLNPSDLPADVTVSVVNRQGTQLSSVQFNLKAREKRAFLLRELMVEVLGETFGSVWVRSSVPVFAIQVFGTWNLSLLSQIPAQPIENISRPATPRTDRFAISGKLKVPPDVAPGGHFVDISGKVSARVQTDYTGTFVFKDLDAGSYLVTPVVLPDLYYVPAATALSVTQNAKGTDFTAVRGTAPPSGNGGNSPPVGGNPPPSTLVVSPIEVQIRVTSNTVGVGAYQVTVGFNPHIVALASADVLAGTAPFDKGPIAVLIDNNAGTVTLNDFQTGPGPVGTTTVARLRFTGIAVGDSALTVGSDAMVFDSNGDAIPGATITLSSNSVSVR